MLIWAYLNAGMIDAILNESSFVNELIEFKNLGCFACWGVCEKEN